VVSGVQQPAVCAWKMLVICCYGWFSDCPEAAVGQQVRGNATMKHGNGSGLVVQRFVKLFCGGWAVTVPTEKGLLAARVTHTPGRSQSLRCCKACSTCGARLAFRLVICSALHIWACVP
jgi:hypothetical protein